ncbi:MAG: two-component regulator propeller domain-containing protein [Paludibacter sp.]|nr:two-component regulator propeller domain-containing protein [Paludibacter sp.]
MKKSIFCLMIVVSFRLSALNYDITAITNNDGLSNSSINCVLQDNEGLMWFGSWDGLNRYNGKEFKVYKPDSSNPRGISNNIIRDIIEQESKYIWITTDFGINKYDKKTKYFDRFFVDARNKGITVEHSFLVAQNSVGQIFASVYKQGLFYFDEGKNSFVLINIARGFHFKKIFFDLDDNLWVLTNENSLYKIVFKKGNDHSMPERIVRFNHLNNIESVFYQKNNEIWIQTSDKKFFVYKISEGDLIESRINTTQKITIRAIVFENKDQIWGTNEGLFSFDTTTGDVKSIIPNISVLSLLQGSQDILWVGTDMQGVWQLAPSKEKFHSYLSDNMGGFGKSAVRTFAEDNQMLWVGTKGSGIFVFTKEGNHEKLNFKQHFTTANGLLSNSVFAINKDSQNELWIGTDGKGINYFDKKSSKFYSLQINDSLQKKINLSSIYSILPEAENFLWVGTSGYGMYKLEINKYTRPYSVKSYKQFIYRENDPASLSNNIVYSIIRDDKTHLWIATRGGGLNRFNVLTEKSQAFRFTADDHDALSSDDVLCLYKDRKGILWAGTSMGLNKLVGYKNLKPVFTHFTEKDGMPNNTIHGILEDGEKNLWLSTNKGIAKLIKEKKGYRIIAYYKKDGLQNNEFSDGAFYKSPATGVFYFGGINGFNVFNPLEIVHSSYMPNLLLDAFYLDNEETNIDENIKNGNLLVSYKNKSFSFRFIPVDYISGSKCEISYMLKGFQKEWIQLGTSNTIVFSNLPQGEYELKVRCSNADKIWSNQYYTLRIRMLPPWYQSKIAYATYTLLFLLLVFGIQKFVRYQINIKNNIRLKELDKQKTEEIHQEKLRFFTNIAHEFSNSLTLIYGPCEQLLRAHSTDNFTRKYINVIKSNSERMQSLIQQLIDFRKAETGHLKLQIEQIDIPELVRFEADNFQDVLEQKRIQLQLLFSPEKIIWNTDRDSLDKIVFNLISNAVKYTPQDETIEISVTAGYENLTLRVTNTGIGIDPEYQNNIFDRFEVLNRFEKQVSKGLETRNGIGLALCKSITEVLHGSISVESDGNSFTSFVVSIPQNEIYPDEKESVPIVFPRKSEEIQTDNSITENDDITIHDSPKNGLILVIDDEKEIRKLLKDFLNSKYEIAEASNGQEAIEVMKLRLPVLIICDVIMPVMDGVEFMKIMKQQELTRHIPIILLSSKSTIENQIEGLETGADAYLGKPFHPRYLEATIESLLHRNKAILDYSDSPYSAVELYEGNIIKKEDKILITNITEIIYSNLDNDKLSLDLIANETAISKMQLYRKMKEILGLTPTEYIRSIRLKQAEKLLKTTNKTVQEIMYLCGFNNKAYFYREFLKKYHATPKEYRNQLSQH